MSASVLYMSMSLDGYIAGPNDELGRGLGDGGERLHYWGVTPDGEFFRPAGPAGQLIDEMNATGAILAGRRTAEFADHWGGAHHGVPIFVPSSPPPGPSVANYPLVTYVTDGIASAMAQAKAAAGDRNVMVHGAYTAQRALEAGVLDELENPPDPGAVRWWPSAVRGVAVARRAGDRPGDRHAAGHPHPLPRPSLSRPTSSLGVPGDHQGVDRDTAVGAGDQGVDVQGGQRRAEVDGEG